MSDISIIILTFNSSNYISDLLKSLISLKENIEIIVVDNNSSDDTLEKVEKFQEIKIIKNLENLGFAKGINIGVKSAKSKYILFINPDSVFENGKLEYLSKFLNENEKIGIVGGKIIDPDGNPEKSAGKFFNLIEVIFLVLGLDEALGIRSSPRRISQVDFVSGGFMMVRSELFRKLKGFDEKFFMYVEDMEFCYRAKKLGAKTYFFPDAIISHAGQGSSSRGFAIENIYKGIIYFYKKHKGSLSLNIVKLLLKLKALSIISLGNILGRKKYIDTYQKALNAIS